MIERFKERWDVKSNFQLLVIFFVFSVTGSAAVMVRGWLFHWMGVDTDINILWLIPIYIVTIVPIYQMLLLVIGTALGQFQFFWKFEKKMLRRFGVKF
ncbi:DUF6787 family protein [Sunxiuqinia sp. A32]|uniref:DUF6787 family protein n=1 Tax=Sunxiuqinia sp. A32 TaxID=3461496 RepID=UPI0040457822